MARPGVKGKKRLFSISAGRGEGSQPQSPGKWDDDVSRARTMT